MQWQIEITLIVGMLILMADVVAIIMLAVVVPRILWQMLLPSKYVK